MFRLIRLIIEIAVIIGVITILMKYMPQLINLVHKGISELKYLYNQL